MVSTAEARPASARRATSKRRRSGLRFQVLNAFVDGTLAGLTRAELAVWLILYRDAKPPHGDARASLDDLARRGGMHRQSAAQAIRSLAARKLVKVTRRGGLNRGPSTYRVFPFLME